MILATVLAAVGFSQWIERHWGEALLIGLAWMFLKPVFELLLSLFLKP